MSFDWTSAIRDFHGPIRGALDVGANVGGFIPTWLSLGAKRVIAMEPVPECWMQMADRYKGDVRVLPLRMGASDENSRAENLNVHNCWTLLPDLGTGGTPTDHGVGRALEFVGKPSFSVAFDTIDRVLSDLNFTPDFLKIDTDGYDAKALRGASSHLMKHRPLIMLELSYLPSLPEIDDCCGCMVRDLYARGYRMQSVVDGRVFATARDVMRVYPWDTSWDVLCWPLGEGPTT